MFNMIIEGASKFVKRKCAECEIFPEWKQGGCETFPEWKCVGCEMVVFRSEGGIPAPLFEH
jgi:ribosomal protein S27E